MTQDEIIRMAREAGLAEWHESVQQHGFRFADLNNLERFAALVAAHEREAIAKVCESWDFNAQSLVKAIRARGEQ